MSLRNLGRYVELTFEEDDGVQLLDSQTGIFQSERSLNTSFRTSVRHSFRGLDVPDLLPEGYPKPRN